MDKVTVIERSQWCFVAGLCGLIPLLGLGPAVVAIHLYHRTRRMAGGEWNPAGAYAKAGFVLGWCGVLSFTLTLGSLLQRAF